MEEYKPIDCGIYDQFILFITRKRRLLLEIKAEDGEITKVSSRIIDLVTRNKEEFAILEDQSIVRLDRLKVIKELDQILE